MNPSIFRHARYVLFVALLIQLPTFGGQEGAKKQSLDDQVRTFLEVHKSEWHDMNIPMRDGEVLHDLIVKNKYTRALEIGTSTGHSAIWIAWALSKTGGKLITIEINERRYKEALANFKAAGVSEYIDARLADAHQLVKELPGPFDFVFNDADKDWYKQYFIDIAPKMAVGGCYTAHNIRAYGGGYGRATQEFVDYVQDQANFETSIETTRSTGILISYKRSKEKD